MKAILWETQLKSQRTDGDATLAPTARRSRHRGGKRRPRSHGSRHGAAGHANSGTTYIQTPGESEPTRATGRRREARGSYLLPRREAAAAAEGSEGHAWGLIPARRRRGSPGLPSFLPAAGRRRGRWGAEAEAEAEADAGNSS